MLERVQIIFSFNRQEFPFNFRIAFALTLTGLRKEACSVIFEHLNVATTCDHGRKVKKENRSLKFLSLWHKFFNVDAKRISSPRLKRKRKKSDCRISNK